MRSHRFGDIEPDAGITPEGRRHFLSLMGLFLAGPTIWITHFFVVYLPAEALCEAGVDTEFFGLHVVSAFTLGATALAVAAVAVTSHRAHRRWRDSGAGWGGSSAGPPGRGDGGDHDAQLALAGYLLGLLFALAILFVGLPAVVLAC